MAIVKACYTPMKVCRLRAVRLDANDAFAASPDNAYTTDVLASFQFTPTTRTGEEITERDGCGALIVDFKDPDSPTGRGDVNLTLLQVHPELVEILTGGTVLMSDDATPVAIGYEPPGVGSDRPSVALELWAWAFDGDDHLRNGAGDIVYERIAVPKVKLSAGEFTMNNGVRTLPLTGTGYANANFGDGPESDWPAAISIPGASFLDEGGLPTAACGYEDLVLA